MENKIELLAHIKPSGKWLKVDGDGEATLTFLVPGNQLTEVLKICTICQNANLKITIEPSEP